jgi:hypothetical protein
MNDTGFEYAFIDPIILSEQELLDGYKKAVNDYNQLLVRTDWTGEGVSSRKQLMASIEGRMMNYRMALKQKNPNKYGTVVRQSNMWRLN